MTLNAVVLLRATAARHPNRVAMTAGAAEMTYAQLAAHVSRVGGLLRSRGIGKGDRVALVLPNSFDFATSFFGALTSGATVVPVNTLGSRREIAHVLRDSDAKLLITDPEWGDNALAAATDVGLREVLVAGPGDERRAELLDKAVLHSGSLDPAPTMPEDDAVILYTSGTTGQPKGACLSHSSIAWITEILATRVIRATEQDVFLAALPLSHIFGLVAVLCVSTVSGGCVVLQRKFDPEGALDLMAERKVTVFEGVPAMCRALLAAQRRRATAPNSTLQLAFLGGQSTPVEVLRQFESTFGCTIIECYGTTETGSAISATPRTGLSSELIGTVGLPLWGVDVKIVDGRGFEVEPDEVGEVLARSIGNMSRYHDNERETAVSLRDGWFHTGDLGRVDGQGVLTIVDRKKELIIRGGYNVYPREIEEVLYEHPAVAEAAVVGIPDERNGEEVAAVVAFHRGASATEQEVQDFVRERVSAYKFPRIVRVVDELPKNATGKVSKKMIDPDLLIRERTK